MHGGNVCLRGINAVLMRSSDEVLFAEEIPGSSVFAESSCSSRLVEINDTPSRTWAYLRAPKPWSQWVLRGLRRTFPSKRSAGTGVRCRPGWYVGRGSFCDRKDRASIGSLVQSAFGAIGKRGAERVSFRIVRGGALREMWRAARVWLDEVLLASLVV